MGLTSDILNKFAYALGIGGTADAATIDAAITAAGAGGNTAAGAITQAMDAPNSRDATIVANGADDNLVGVIPVLFRIKIAAGALATKNLIMTHKIRVIDAWLHLDGAGVATTTLQLLNGVTAITDAMAASGAIKAVVRCAQIDATQQDIAAGGTLAVVSATGATQPAATLFVLGIRVP